MGKAFQRGPSFAFSQVILEVSLFLAATLKRWTQIWHRYDRYVHIWQVRFQHICRRIGKVRKVRKVRKVVWSYTLSFGRTRSGRFSTRCHSCARVWLNWLWKTPEGWLHCFGSWNGWQTICSKPAACQELDDGWPESVEEQSLLLLVWRHAFYTQALLHTDAFTHRDFYTHRRFLHAGAFTHRSFYTDALWHRPFYTQTLLHTDAFCTQALLHTEAFTHRRF